MDIMLIFVFVIAAFLGLELIAKVPSQLHTPLMSGTNAISGITVVVCKERIFYARKTCSFSALEYKDCARFVSIYNRHSVERT